MVVLCCLQALNREVIKGQRIFERMRTMPKSISLEPNWERVWAWFMHVKKTDRPAFNRMVKKMGKEWDKFIIMAEQKGWKND